jgi:hypothetical protein
MKSDLASVEKYQVITPSAIASTERVVRFYLLSLTLSILLWCLFSFGTGFCVAVQVFFIIIGSIIYYATHASESGFVRSKLELKAKGLDIKAPTMHTIMPWDYLTKVEIRQRNFDIIRSRTHTMLTPCAFTGVRRRFVCLDLATLFYDV